MGVRHRFGGKEAEMHNCMFCRNPLNRNSEWKASEGRFYCNEYCADAEDSTAFLATRSEMAKKNVVNQ
jgi:hypothetical protein